MNWLFWHGKVNDNYGWELDLFHRYRNKEDGFTTFEFKANLDKYPCDHNPHFELSLILCNFIIFDFEIYNVWHADHEQSPYFQMPETAKLIQKNVSTLKVIVHSRRNFYMGKSIYWYEFILNSSDPTDPRTYDYSLPDKFLKVPYTEYYEYGGTHAEAIKDLNEMGVYDIVEGDEI